MNNFLNNKKSVVMKETSELVNSVFDTTAQAVESFADGFQLTDVAQFLDEAVDWPAAVNGLNAMGSEAKVITVEQVDAIFLGQREKLVEAGMNDMLAAAITANAQGVYFVYAAIKQAGGEAVTVRGAKV